MVTRFLFCLSVVCLVGLSTSACKKHERHLPPPAVTANAAPQSSAQSTDVRIVFVGDSITKSWTTTGNKIWTQRFTKWNPLNAGISGDTTDGVLKRLREGQLNGLSPEVIVLMIGTNDLAKEEGDYGNKAIVRRIREIVNFLLDQHSQSKILLLGILPRSESAEDQVRERIKRINSRLAKMDWRDRVRYLDLGYLYVDEKGNIPEELMPDYLHPSQKGYRLFADVLEETLDEMTYQDSAR